MVDIISGNNTYRFEPRFYNIRAHVIQKECQLVVEFRAELHIEPLSRYLVLIKNPKNDLTYKVINEETFYSDFQDNVTLSNGIIINAIVIGRSTTTFPGFPFIVEMNTTNNTRLNFVGAMHAVSHKQFEFIPIVVTQGF